MRPVRVWLKNRGEREGCLFLLYEKVRKKAQVEWPGLSVRGGASYEIQWKVKVSDTELGAVVPVEFSKDGGKSWEMVEDNLPNAGKYLWQVPKKDSTQCKIRVFSQRRPEYRGTFGVFTAK